MLLPPAPFLFAGLTERTQLFEQRALIGRGLFRNMHLNAQIEIAVSATAELLQAFAAQAQHLVRLGTGRNRDVHFSPQGLYSTPFT